MSEKDLKTKMASRSGLRLIVNRNVLLETATEAPSASAGSDSSSDEANRATAPKSNLAAFMSAYADAIDRDIEMILGL